MTQKNQIKRVSLGLLCSLFSALVFANPEVPADRQERRNQVKTGAKASKSCTAESLNKFRSSEFKREFDAKRFAEAGDSLQSYIDKNDCYTALAYENKQDASLSAYLWAVSDLAFARLSAGQFAKCIEIAGYQLTAYSNNALQKSTNSKLRAALESSLKRCESGRFEGLTKIEMPTACTFSLTGASVSLAGLGEDTDKLRPMKIGKIRQSALSADKKTCIAVVEVPVDADLLDGEEGAPKIAIPFLVKATSAKDVQILDAMNSRHPTAGYVCGDLKLTPYQKHDHTVIYRVGSGMAYCHGGTASGVYDAFWMMDPAPIKLDEINYWQH